MISVFIILSHFHWFEVLKTSFLCNFIFAFVSVVFEVTYVGDVTNITYFITEVFKITEHEVESDSWTSVTEVSVAVNGRTTYIHSYMRSVERLEQFL